MINFNSAPTDENGEKIQTVFSVGADTDNGTHDGTHLYRIQALRGRDKNGNWKLSDGREFNSIHFFERFSENETEPGIIDLQIICMLIDRAVRLNFAYPCKETESLLNAYRSAKKCLEDLETEHILGKVKI
jgi:hypothetical protein